MNQTVYAARRARVLEALGDDGALVLAASPELVVGADTDVRYHPDPDLFYLTGYTEPECVLVLSAAAEHVFTLFVRPRDPDRERWTGPRGGVEAAAAIADAAYPIQELPTRMAGLLAGAAHVHVPFTGMRSAVEAAVRDAVLSGARARVRTGRGTRTIEDARVLLSAQRLIKDETELGLMRSAAVITVAAFREMARGLPRMTHEYEAEAVIEHGFRIRGAQGPAFPTIAAAGANATVLHYTANNARFARDSMLLVDAGARYGMYCADVTRTLPIGGGFTAAQRDAYEVVRAAHGAAVACVRPGESSAAMDDAALRVLTEGMVSLGLLHGAVDDLVGQRAYRAYFPHRISHWLGLDVHDAGDYMVGSEPVRFAPNMVLTVEPGLYVPAEDQAAPAALRGMGIRLEDDVLVTASGAEILTGELELDPAAVEELTAAD